MYTDNVRQFGAAVLKNTKNNLMFSSLCSRQVWNWRNLFSDFCCLWISVFVLHLADLKFYIPLSESYLSWVSSLVSAMTRLGSKLLVISSRAFSGIMSGQSQTIYSHTGCSSKLLFMCFIFCIWWCKRLDNRENTLLCFYKKKQTKQIKTTFWELLLLVRVCATLRVHQASKSVFHSIVFEWTFRLTLVTDYTMCGQQFQQWDFKQSWVKQ